LAVAIIVVVIVIRKRKQQKSGLVSMKGEPSMDAFVDTLNPLSGTQVSFKDAFEDVEYQEQETGIVDASNERVPQFNAPEQGKVIASTEKKKKKKKKKADKNKSKGNKPLTTFVDTLDLAGTQPVHAGVLSEHDMNTDVVEDDDDVDDNDSARQWDEPEQGSSRTSKKGKIMMLPNPRSNAPVEE
jgi:hypothetical protein